MKAKLSPYEQAKIKADQEGYFLPTDTDFLKNSQFIQNFLGNQLNRVPHNLGPKHNSRDFNFQAGYEAEALFGLIVDKHGYYYDAVKGLGFDINHMPDAPYLLRYLAFYFPDTDILNEFPFIEDSPDNQQGVNNYEDHFIQALVLDKEKKIKIQPQSVLQFNQLYKKFVEVSRQHFYTFAESKNDFSSFRAQMELFIKQQPTASYVRFPCDKTKIQRFPWINEVIASRIFYSKFVVTNKRKSPVPIQKCVFGFDKEMFDLPTKECLRDLCFSEDQIEDYMNEIYRDTW